VWTIAVYQRIHSQSPFNACLSMLQQDKIVTFFRVESPHLRSHRPVWQYFLPTVNCHLLLTYFGSFHSAASYGFPISLLAEKWRFFITWPQSLTYDLNYEFDLGRVKISHQAKYLGQRSFHSKVIVRMDRHTTDQKCSVKAKFHYASWFEAGRRQVRSSSATSFEPAPNQLA